MLPNPLHPIIAHFPIVLTVLLPFLVVVALVAIHRGMSSFRTWVGVVVLNVLLVLSSWTALVTGEQEEERVEIVVAEQLIELHEEAAESFMGLTVLVLALAGVGLLRGRVGNLARAATAIAALVLLIEGIQVGHLGGDLVYKYGAGQAYIQATGADMQHPLYGVSESHEDDDVDDDDDDDDDDD